MDARLPDGSRVNVVIPPLALDGPALTIRRFRRRGFAPEDLVATAPWTRRCSSCSARAVRARRTRAGLRRHGIREDDDARALSARRPPGSASSRSRTPRSCACACRTWCGWRRGPPNLEGRGEVTIRPLVRNALRMRPDRIVVGEVRGPEALDLLSALTTGHAGSLCTIHAGGAAEALRRLETLALMADVGLPHGAIREQVADAIDLIVCQARGADGVRRVVEVAEVVRAAGGPGLREVFRLRGAEES